jgi:N-methylhydantoinase B
VKMTVKGSNIIVDLSDSDPQCLGAINSPIANTMSAVYYSLQFFLDPTAPQNEGMFEPIEVITKEGTWLHPVWPGPTIGCTVLAAPKVASAIWQTIAKAIPDRAVGSACGDGNWFVCGVRDADGKTDVFTDLPAGGWGGTPFSDGMNVTMDPLGNCMNMEAETAELLFPMIAYEAYDLRQNSAGAGRHRGGLGANFKVRFRCDGQMNVETSRTLEGTPGVNGGKRSMPQRLWHLYADGREEIIGGIDEAGTWHNPLLCRYPFAYGDTFVFETTGGGGWGDPHLRSPEEVLEDVIDEYISEVHAREVYGVVVSKAEKTVDMEATAKLRASA